MTTATTSDLTPNAAPTTETTTPKPTPEWIAGFWRRVLGYVIDVSILAFVGFLLGSLFESIFIELGGWARLVGFGVGIAYFGVLNSRIGGGKTLGKRLLGIVVVDRNNQLIGLGRSMARYSILAVPFLLNGAPISMELLMSVAVYPLSILLFGGIFVITYLIIFNRRTRQSLHDVITGTYVVKSDAKYEAPRAVWNGHWVVTGLLVVLAALAPVLSEKLLEQQPFQELLAAQLALSEEADVIQVGVTIGTNTIWRDGDSHNLNYVSATAQIGQDSVDDRERAKEIAKLVMQTYPNAVNQDVINVTFVHGYDIGIWSKSSTHSHDFLLSELSDGML
ncbi:RDD family protein [Umboniibacter marinipuniceus]|uniref:Putative RDD family membrane protein YckC n=1 Tax=Umboniibacter marinipuniceus TaxID=569599 RepID=A0A3M0ABU3_9GAMM|nr:RDD family protein [Umboniibacter marinipuniceus]RMA82633.1 putative RDD family membrane protein YckC [Umboniibacter marinipuniceus]